MLTSINFAAPEEKATMTVSATEGKGLFFFGKYLTPHSQTVFFNGRKKWQPFAKTNIIVETAVLRNKLCALCSNICVKKYNFSVMPDISQKYR